MKRDKILVTGGSGFIGAELIKRLTRLTDRVSSVESFDAVLGKDIRSAEQIDDAMCGIDAVFHLAAVADLNWVRAHPIEAIDVNIKGTWNVAEACRKHHTRLYFASTCCVYGNQKSHPATEETLPNPAEIYACSKLAGEYVIKGFHYTYGTEYAIIRFATIYGPGTRPALATHIFLGQALRGEPITVHGDGKQTRTLTYIADLADAIIALYRSNLTNDTWNLTATEEISAMQMAGDIKQLTGSKSKIELVEQRVGQTFRESVSAEKIKRDTGWEAKVRWEDGIKAMHKWFKETGQIANKYTVPT